ncbi:Hypothetical predicted protein [Xyrichtys novacula]|uniref:Uncharacterized protein n=1 Tax=Xyrichtys novacula TaxID=13765 RepID=A0AAV1FPT8_XYRNO|nr:Hypothetical predicted protein [Xyrichtys novacula]
MLQRSFWKKSSTEKKTKQMMSCLMIKKTLQLSVIRDGETRRAQHQQIDGQSARSSFSSSSSSSSSSTAAGAAAALTTTRQIRTQTQEEGEGKCAGQRDEHVCQLGRDDEQQRGGSFLSISPSVKDSAGLSKGHVID